MSTDEGLRLVADGDEAGVCVCTKLEYTFYVATFDKLHWIIGRRIRCTDDRSESGWPHPVDWGRTGRISQTQARVLDRSRVDLAYNLR